MFQKFHSFNIIFSRWLQHIIYSHITIKLRLSPFLFHLICLFVIIKIYYKKVEWILNFIKINTFFKIKFDCNRALSSTEISLVLCRTDKFYIRKFRAHIFQRAHTHTHTISFNYYYQGCEFNAGQTAYCKSNSRYRVLKFIFIIKYTILENF